jgi:hypothetical protein
MKSLPEPLEEKLSELLSNLIKKFPEEIAKM